MEDLNSAVADYVVGHYGIMGEQISEGSALEGRENVAKGVEEHLKQYGITANLPKKRGRKPKDNVSKKEVWIAFITSLAKIKFKVIDIVEIPSALCLVIKETENLVFEPQPGEILEIECEKLGKVKIMYPGFIFPYLGVKLVILVKA